MNKEQRQRKLNRTAEIIFSGNVTEDDFAELLRAAQYRGCPVCRDSFQVKEGVSGADGRRYCSQGCMECAERDNAPMVKPQPTGLKVMDASGGVWDV